MMPKVSVIVTVKNEQHTIGALIESLLAQSSRPDEIVIVDGGSSDDTVQTVQSYVIRGAPIKLVIAKGTRISEGRNIAVENANGEIIAATDAGVRLSLNWLKDLLVGFHSADSTSVDVVSGFFVPDPQTTFESAMGATVLPSVEEINGETFLPSSRSIAFRKQAWSTVGGYPEWLDYCEDLVFDLNLRAAGCRFVFAPSAIAFFRPRQNLRQFFRQYYLYSRGDGKAGLWPKRHALRYATYGLAPIALALGFWYKVSWLLLAVACFAYLHRPYRRLWPLSRKLRRTEQLKAILWVPIIRLTGDVAKMIGYPAGIWWRLRNIGPNS